MYRIPSLPSDRGGVSDTITYERQIHHVNETYIRSGHPNIDALLPRIREFLANDSSEYIMLGTKVRGYRAPDAPSIWLRDHSDMMRGFKYWEADMVSTINHFAEMQSARGWIFDYFTTNPEKVPCEKENWAKYVRVPVEADVEYRFIKAMALAWQSTGDDRWLRKILPHAERALEYALTDDWRWDNKRQLVKRAYTIDTWDFDYTAGRHPWLNFQVTDRTFWGIMHGDSSGYYEAFTLLSRFYQHLKNTRRAAHWAKFAESFRRRANKTSFNGRFYTHQIPLVPVSIDGVDTSEQLSLSNAMNINRGLASHDMAVSILQEYQRREQANGAFAAWYSIDPPFPSGIFGDEKIVTGMYCNGGIMPLVGGEIARAAFEHGFEEFGVEQLLKYEKLTANNESYLWYFPDGRHATVETSTSPDASPTDGWGSSSMLYALMEGLAGVVDDHKLFRKVRLSPRWPAARVTTASVCARYQSSAASFEYTYEHQTATCRILLELNGKADIALHVLLPKRARAKRVLVNGKAVRHRNVMVRDSPYADAGTTVRSSALVEIRY